MMKKTIFFGTMAFVYYTSSAIAMHPGELNPHGSRQTRMQPWFETITTGAELSEIFQRDPSGLCYKIRNFPFKNES